MERNKKKMISEVISACGGDLSIIKVATPAAHVRHVRDTGAQDAEMRALPARRRGSLPLHRMPARALADAQGRVRGEGGGDGRGRRASAFC
jgi:hypothetical protein